MEQTKRIILIDLKGKRYYLDVPLNSDKDVVIWNDVVFVRDYNDERPPYFYQVESYYTNAIFEEHRGTEYED